MANSEFIEELTNDFLLWQQKQGKLKNLKDYADFLGIHRVTLSRYLNGSVDPSNGTLVILAQKTGNPRYYDFANAPRPDPLLSSINKNWERVPEDVQQKVSDLIAPYVTERHEHKSPQPRSAENSA